ncbi:hypothetical protein CBOM_03872 [Ceraceosorus bombacis]|uniref:Uncharacterized protein n=1 Tax=Ceraceosorus bombacis TaxID=401625 RepID=A0A0P1BIA0_9BASI|nr:hypothetical protein CBOM_03872 [Ceraceosorus bombacis]
MSSLHTPTSPSPSPPAINITSHSRASDSAHLAPSRPLGSRNASSSRSLSASSANVKNASSSSSTSESRTGSEEEGMTMMTTMMMPPPPKIPASRLWDASEANVVRSRSGTVLTRGLVLKADGGAKRPRLDLHLQGAPNFRRADCDEVYGCAQPTWAGLRGVLSVLNCQPAAASSSYARARGRPTAGGVAAARSRSADVKLKRDEEGKRSNETDALLPDQPRALPNLPDTSA